MANGSYTFTLDVENSRALKRLADFTKASEQATQRVTKDLKKQLEGNIKLKKSLESLKKRYEKGQKAAIKSQKAGVIEPRVIASQRNLKNRIQETTTAIEKGRRAASGYRNELSRLSKVAPPPGPVNRRGFSGNVGRRAGVGKAFSAAGSQRGGMAAAALTGSAAGLAAAGATAAIAGVVALTAATISYGNAAAIAATKQSKFQKALVGVLGDETVQGLTIIQDTVEKYNVPLQTATENFTRLAAATRSAGVSTEDAKAVFQGMVVANKALGGSNEQLNGILLATQQVFSKGKVSAEELRGQIGERLPGAVSLFASSMGKTTAELDKALEQGTVSVEDFVNFSKKLFEEFEESATKLSNSPEEAGARLEKALNKLQINVGKLLAPVGAAFQDVFTEIVKVINTAALALLRFYNIGLDNKLNKAIQERAAATAAFEAFGDSETRSLGQARGGEVVLQRSDAEKRLRAATKKAAELQVEFNKSIGKGQAGMNKGDLLTTEDMLNARGGRGGKGSNAAADAARRLAKVQAQEVLKVAKLELSLLNENNKRRMGLLEQSLTAEKAAQTAILHTYILQNDQLEVRSKKFLADIKLAESELAAAQIRLEASAGGPDALTAQGAVDEMQAKLSGARKRSEVFEAVKPDMQRGNFAQSMFATTAESRQSSANMQQQVDLLKTRNRLIMEGFGGPALDAAMNKAEIDRLQGEQISAINHQKSIGLMNDTEALYRIQSLTAAFDAERAAVDAVTEAQNSGSIALFDYINNAQAYLSDVQGHISEITGAMEESIASAITGLIDGTKTAGQAFQDFFKNVGKAFLTMASQMIAKLVIIQLLKTALGMLGGSFGGGANVGQQVDMPSSVGIGAGDGIIQNGGNQGFGTFGPNFGIRQFAKGGIVTGPTNALIGEGGMNEAVVPLPNGRSIPVDFGKANMGSVNNTTITVNVDSDGNSDTQTSDQASKFGVAIDRAVKRVIMDERRSGGLLSGAR